MPSARYEADFTQFNAAVDGASGKLLTFSKSSDWTQQTLIKTDTAAKTSGNAFGTLASGLTTADKTLAAFGVHIGPQIHALEEMSLAAGKTASQLGLIGTAGLLAAAGLAGFETGKLIRDFTGLDEAFSGWIDRTFQLSVATEEAAAKQDVLDRASKNAGHTITSFAEAVNINTLAVEKNKEAIKAHAAQAAEDAKALEKARAETAAYSAHLSDIQNKLMGSDQIAKAQDYMRTFIDVKNVVNLNSEALQEMNDVLSAGFSRLVEQGGAASELAADINTWRLAVIEAQKTHSAAMAQIESDEERVKRENDELAKAMEENFKVIGTSAQEAAAKVSLSWSQAMDSVRAGQGTLTGTIQGIAPGTPGSSVRYDDYGNPYGYVPGVNNPGQVFPSPGGATQGFINNFYVNGTGQDVARVVSDELTRMMSRGGNRVGV